MILNAFTSGTSMRMIRSAFFLALLGLSITGLASRDAAAASDLIVPVNRSEVITLPRDMEEVIIANPDVADVHVHGPRSVSVIGKTLGQTTLRVLDRQDNILGAYNVIVSYDLPAIRRSLKKFLPYEFIELDVVNKNLALTGEVSSASSAQQAVSIVEEYVKEYTPAGAVASDEPAVLNLMKVTAGQQVMLHVRVGEIQRTALKQLGVNLAAVGDAGQQVFTIGTGGGLGGISFPNNGTNVGSFTAGQDTRGIFGFTQQTGSFNFNALIEALERDGLFKSLAEPNLVALSGEKAEFLAGGEFPIPVSQGTTGSLANVTIEFRSFGVGVQFTPYVLSENRIRINVQPEVSELTDEGSVELNGFRVPALTTRRAKTTLELAPGESFMIAGLLSDKLTSQIDALPGLAEVPILSALFRSTAFQRNETELVIAVTPYLVDPIKGTDVRLPTDDFRPASFMESVFYGALGTQNGDAYRLSQTPQLEGPIGFMVD